ncbi:DUF4124 domain-containing protein [Porticoccus sp.]
MIRATLISCLLMATGLCHGEIYRWVDSEGKVHFSDKKPQDSPHAQDISGQLRPLNSDSSTSETEKLQQVFQEETAEEKAFHQRQQTRQQQQEKQRQQACQQAKNQLSVLRGRVAFLDPDGNEIVVTETERERRAEQLEREIRQHCS